MEDTHQGVVGVAEAQETFTFLLKRVAGGEEITITDHGVPVARMIPARSVGSQERKQAALQKMDEIASRCRLDGLRIKNLSNEGRR